MILLIFGVLNKMCSERKYITRIGFRIAAVEEYDGVTAVLESISDISADIEPIERLVKDCNNLQLEPIHLQDVVTDFLATV